MSSDLLPDRPDPPSAAAVAVPGVLDEHTMSHLLDVELARARRYEHPFALVRVIVRGDAAVAGRLSGVLRFHTRWADSVGTFGGALLVILRDTAPDGARFALEKIGASLSTEAAATGGGSLSLASASWRKGDDRASLLARLQKAQINGDAGV
jgi:hypothetical protein